MHNLFNYTIHSHDTQKKEQKKERTQITGSEKWKMKNEITGKYKIKYHLKSHKWRLFLNTETTNFVMIHQVKIYIPSNLLCKVLISCNLDYDFQLWRQYMLVMTKE